MTQNNDKTHQITLYLDTPKPMLRPFRDFRKHNQLEAMIVDGMPNLVALTGHAFIGLSGPDGIEQRCGFSCEASWINCIRGSKGYVCDDSDTPYNEAIIWKVTPEQYKKAQDFVAEKKTNPGGYKLFERNCSTFACDVLHAAGVENVPEEKFALTPYGLAVKKRMLLAERQAEVLKFKVKNAIRGLFGEEKVPTSQLLDSLRSKPIPVPISIATKLAHKERDVLEERAFARNPAPAEPNKAIDAARLIDKLAFVSRKQSGR